jgi:hypothetical protein
MMMPPRQMFLLLLLIVLVACTPTATQEITTATESDNIVEKINSDDNQSSELAKELDPSSLYGLNKTGLIERLGRADYIRIDDNINIFQYRMENCVIDFVLTNIDSEQELTSWHGRHSIQGQEFDEQACRIDLAERARS